MTEKPSLSREEVLAIAELAKLELTDEEVDQYASQLSEILENFQMLQELDTSHIEPTASVLPLKNIMREDVVKPALQPEEVIKNAPQSDENQFLVSAVLGDE